MKTINQLILSLLAVALLSCSSDKHKFPLDKRYWDLNDYDKAVRDLRFGYEDDEQLPRFDDPDSRAVVVKLTDEQNFKIILDDKELGLTHRNNVAKKFFEEWKGMTDIYRARDRKDQYLYEMEMLAVWHFGLGLQPKYFDLGNQQIIKGSDDPDSAETKRLVNSNIRTLIGNYLLYLDEINNEDSFTGLGQVKLAQGIDKYFIALIELYPDADYSNMKKKAELLLKKSNSADIQQTLQKLIKRLGS